MVLDDMAPAKLSPPVGAAPSENLSEITGAIHGLADYIQTMDARTAEIEKALKSRRTPDAARHATIATGYRALAVVAVVALLCAAAVLGLHLWLAAR